MADELPFPGLPNGYSEPPPSTSSPGAPPGGVTPKTWQMLFDAQGEALFAIRRLSRLLHAQRLSVAEAFEVGMPPAVASALKALRQGGET